MKKGIIVLSVLTLLIHLEILSQPTFTNQADFGINTSVSADWGDYDNDGDLDLIVAAWGDEYTFIFLNDGNNNFSPDFNNEIFNEAISVLVADVDNDSDLDIITGVGCCINSSEVYKNDGTGIFSLFSQFGSENSALNSLRIADVDNDGDIDITSNNSGSDEVSIYINDGIGNYSEMLIDNIINNCTEFGDIDNDGDIDLLVGAYGFFSDRIIVYENNEMIFTKHTIETGGFTDFPVYAVSDIAMGDSDNDGDIDIAVMRLIYTDEFTVEIEQNSLFINDFISGIENEVTNHNYRIYPNPSSDFINIELNNLENVNVSIINATGQIIFKKSITEKQIEQIDISDFKKGIYLIIISGQNYSNIEKIIKK